MLTGSNIVFLILSYLLGSIPFSIIAGKLLKSIDVREYGSGNAGATNTFRVLGKKAGILVLLLDVLKGYLAVNLVWYTSYVPSTEIYINLQLTFGIAALSAGEGSTLEKGIALKKKVHESRYLVDLGVSL